MINRLFISVAGLFLIFATTASADDFGSRGAAENAAPSLEEMLVYAIQDEFAARAEYIAIMDAYGEVRPFTNILRSEETHIELLLPLFEQYGYPVPTDTAAEHVVLPDTLQDAFAIGVDAEVANIAMYESFLARRDLPGDVRDVFERLKRASENHLRSFSNGLSRFGV